MKKQVPSSAALRKRRHLQGRRSLDRQSGTYNLADYGVTMGLRDSSARLNSGIGENGGGAQDNRSCGFDR
jgi:hypothetical protein